MIYDRWLQQMVRIIHTPTGTSAQANGNRSQHRNRDSAFSQLKGKLVAGNAFPLPERAVYDLPDDQPNPEDLNDFREEK